MICKSSIQACITWQEVAVLGECISVTDVTVHSSNYTDPRAVCSRGGLRVMNYERKKATRKRQDKEQEEKANNRIHESTSVELGDQLAEEVEASTKAHVVIGMSLWLGHLRGASKRYTLLNSWKGNVLKAAGFCP